MRAWFNRIRKDRLKNLPDAASSSAAASEPKQIDNQSKDLYASDAPVRDPLADRFRRWPFAQRIAQTIANRSDPSGIVIGVYGAWGEGKTTVLNFIEVELNSHKRVICVKFNPWRFGDESVLLRSFFKTLADALDRSMTTRGEKIGEILDKYAAILTPIQLTLGGLVQLSPAQSAQEIGRKLSSVELDDLKNRLGKILAEEGKRVVVLMDDIDRLDKAEVQAIFKLVKLSADFDYTAYILAFDEEMVSAALGEKYSSGRKASGRSFLEKIVQVPLYLPYVDRISLRQFCFEGVDEALSMAEIQLPEDQVQYFVRYFTVGLEERLRTPRMAKQYGNALAFSLPLLKGEVNTVDLMLIEGIRIFYPKIYDAIRTNSDVFIGEQITSYWNNQHTRQRSLEFINGLLESLTGSERSSIIDLLKYLFPLISGVLGGMNYGADFNERWTREKRITSDKYFERYFTYTIPLSDISDQSIYQIIQLSESGNIENISTLLRSLVNRRNADSLIEKLRAVVNRLSPQSAGCLALAISSIGDTLPDPEQMFSFTTPFSQAAILISFLIQRNPAIHERLELASLVIQNSNPLPFAAECFRYMLSSEEEPEKIFSKDEENLLGVILAERVKEFLADVISFVPPIKELPFLLYIWSQYISKDETNDYITTKASADPINAAEFLKHYLPRAWSMDTGVRSRGNFERSQYESVERIVNPDTIFNALRTVYGNEIDNPQYRSYEERTLEKHVAHQFAHIRQTIKSTPDKDTDQEYTDRQSNKTIKEE